MNKRKALHIRLTQAEFDALKTLAEQAKTTVSELVREKLLGKKNVVRIK